MKYCYGCGLKIQDEDLFCINCGAKQESPKGLSSKVKNMDLSGEKDVFINMFLKPITKAKEFVQKAEKGSVILITLFIVFMQGILGMWRANQIISGIEEIAMNMSQKIGKVLNLFAFGGRGEMDPTEILSIKGYVNNIKRFIDMPYGKIFFENMGIVMCLVFSVFIIIYLFCSIVSKNKIDTFKLYKISIIGFVPILNFEALSIICSYGSFYIGSYVAIIGAIISTIVLYSILKETLSIDENNSAFISAVCVMAVVIIIYTFYQNIIIKDIEDIMTKTTRMKDLFGV